MATNIKRLEFKQRYSNYNQGLFILFSEKRFPKDQPVMNLGISLSEKLCEYPKTERSSKVNLALEELIQPFKAVSLSHIELLFTDYLQLDVIRALLALCRNRRICIHWPGEQSANKLVYATPDKPEYYECDYSGLQDTYVVAE